jgi:hypothetical protein
MVFEKGCIPWNKNTVGLMNTWNKGLTKETNIIVRRIANKNNKQIEKICENKDCCKIFYVPHNRINAKYCSTECYGKSKKGYSPWNKGLTEEDPRVRKSIDILKICNIGRSPWNKNKKDVYTKKTLKLMSKIKIENPINYWLGKKNPASSKWMKENNPSKKGKLNHNYGKPATHGKGAYYNGIWMRSSYEIAYAKWLDKNNMKWLYEPKAFEITYEYNGKDKEGTYRPDFYLPETDEYIELKGYWRDDAKVKFESFKEQYPMINIKLLMQKDLKDLGFTFRKGIVLIVQ